MSIDRLAVLAATACLLAACGSFQPAPKPGGPRVAPSQQQQAQRNAIAAIELLETGHEEQARSELRRALATDPNNRLAQSLLHQITADPVASLGRESFAYTVRPRDTMASIAGRFLGDAQAFYLLARYNGIRVPRQLTAGDVIRIPGRPAAPSAGAESRRPAAAPPSTAVPVEPPPPAEPEPPAPPAAARKPTPGELTLRDAQAAEQAGDLDAALNGYRRAATLEPTAAATAGAEAVRAKLVARHSSQARSALAREDLDGSIRQWDRVLQIDPDNETARLERRRALRLKDKVRALKH